MTAIPHPARLREVELARRRGELDVVPRVCYTKSVDSSSTDGRDRDVVTGYHLPAPDEMEQLVTTTDTYTDSLAIKALSYDHRKVSDMDRVLREIAGCRVQGPQDGEVYAALINAKGALKKLAAVLGQILRDTRKAEAAGLESPYAAYALWVATAERDTRVQSMTQEQHQASLTELAKEIGYLAANYAAIREHAGKQPEYNQSPHE
jgi:hypothetical protein